MAVHWNKTDAGTSPKDFAGRTVKHSKPYCRCPNGRCESGWQTPPKKELKPKNNLAARRASFDALGNRRHPGLKRPGSNKK